MRSYPSHPVNRRRTQAPRRNRALSWLVFALTLAAAATLVPFWAPLMLAAWGTLIAWPLQQRLSKALRRPKLSAALLTGLLVVLILLPIVVATLLFVEQRDRARPAACRVKKRGRGAEDAIEWGRERLRFETARSRACARR